MVVIYHISFCKYIVLTNHNMHISICFGLLTVICRLLQEGLLIGLPPNFFCFLWFMVVIGYLRLFLDAFFSSSCIYMSFFLTSPTIYPARLLFILLQLLSPESILALDLGSVFKSVYGFNHFLCLGLRVSFIFLSLIFITTKTSINPQCVKLLPLSVQSFISLFTNLLLDDIIFLIKSVKTPFQLFKFWKYGK